MCTELLIKIYDMPHLTGIFRSHVVDYLNEIDRKNEDGIDMYEARIEEYEIQIKSQNETIEEYRRLEEANNENLNDNDRGLFGGYGRFIGRNSRGREFGRMSRGRERGFRERGPRGRDHLRGGGRGRNSRGRDFGGRNSRGRDFGRGRDGGFRGGRGGRASRGRDYIGHDENFRIENPVDDQ